MSHQPGGFMKYFALILLTLSLISCSTTQSTINNETDEQVEKTKAKKHRWTASERTYIER